MKNIYRLFMVVSIGLLYGTHSSAAPSWWETIFTGVPDGSEPLQLAYDKAYSLKVTIDQLLTKAQKQELNAEERKQLNLLQKRIPGQIAALEEARKETTVLLGRASKNFVQELDQWVKDNLRKAGLEASDVYSYLYGAALGQAARSYTADAVKAHVQEKMKRAPEQDKLILRQLAFFFDNTASKEQFDAYLAGEGEVRKLMRDDAVRLTYLLENITNLKFALTEDQERIAALLR